MSGRHAALNAQLTAFSSLDRAETAARSRMLTLLESPDALSRYHYEPGHFTASAFVLDPTGSAVVLVDHPKIGRWLQPGGHVEPDDADLESAARREVLEETGLTDVTSLGLVDLDVHTFPAHGDQPTHLHFDVRFAFRAHTDVLDVGDHGAAWVPLDDVDRWSDEESILRPVSKLARLVARP